MINERAQSLVFLSFIPSFRLRIFTEKKKAMILTQIEEIKSYLPTSVYDSSSELLSLTEDAEENYLVPILGRDLYNRVEEIYWEQMNSVGSVLPQDVCNEAVTPEIRLIRLCQMPVIYFALANSTGILSVSLNGGAGFSQVSTDGYEAADDKSISRFERDAFFKARRGIDRLLIFLEEDARSEQPLFGELWKQSDYFYRQGDLLFTTAVEMNRFLNIDGSREKFIALLPDIRYCQDTYLSPMIGEDLLDAFISSCTNASVIEDGNGVNSKVWRKTMDYLRMALAIYVENRRPEKQRRYSENEATLSLKRAADYIAKNQEAYGKYIKTSPLYKPIKETSGVGEGSERFDYTNPDNAIFVFGRGGINRH